MPMLRPHRITPRPRPPEPSAANPLHGWAQRFCEWTVTVGLSPSTAKMREHALTSFIRWADERGLAQPGEFTRPVLQRYQRHVYLARKKDGNPWPGAPSSPACCRWWPGSSGSPVRALS